MLGPGILNGIPVRQLVGIRPGDAAYVDHTGAVFHPQDENNGNGNIAHYEIQDTADVIDFDVAPFLPEYTTPHIAFYTPFGPIDFDVVEPETGETLMSEQSGFDDDIWQADISPTSGRLRITNFDTDDGVDGTQSAWYPFVSLFDTYQ